MQFKDEFATARSQYDVRFTDEAELEAWEHGRVYDDWENPKSGPRESDVLPSDPDPL